VQYDQHFLELTKTFCVRQSYFQPPVYTEYVDLQVCLACFAVSSCLLQHTNFLQALFLVLLQILLWFIARNVGVTLSEF
jgi:hypothetical protein